MRALRADFARQLNSMTKYPSIPVYHQMDEKGNLLDTLAVVFGTGEVQVTEKIDGANTRLIIFPNGQYVIGSKEELLHASGDIIHNATQGIVDALKPYAEQLVEIVGEHDGLVVVFMETYGGMLPAAKFYTNQRETAHAIFDVAFIDGNEFDEMTTWEPSQIASWRDHGGQDFYGYEDIHDRVVGIGDFDMVPDLGHFDKMPTDVTDCLKFMNMLFPTRDTLGFKQTHSAINDAPAGRSEGIVVRSAKRTQIAKLRFEDYTKAVRRRHEGGLPGDVV